jgi:hypothetical protein
MSFSVLFDSQVGVARRLERAGGALENPYVYNDVAEDLKSLAGQGWLDVLAEESVDRGGELLIDHITFIRRR